MSEELADSERNLKIVKEELENHIVKKNGGKYYYEDELTKRTDVIMKSNLAIINYLLAQANDSEQS